MSSITDTSDLPPEVREQLPLLPNDETDDRIKEIIGKLAEGGHEHVHADQVVIAYWNLYKKVLKRDIALTRLRRLARQGVLERVPRRKARYALAGVSQREEVGG